MRNRVISNDTGECNDTGEVLQEGEYISSEVSEESESCVENDDSQFFVSDSFEDTVMGYDVGEYRSHPMILQIIMDIERQYIDERDVLSAGELMYYLVRDRICMREQNYTFFVP